jgi:RHS repeat-associated protein
LGLLKGTFIVDPGADPALIRWRYPGTQNVTLDAATGHLAIDLVPAACEARGPEAGCAVVERSPLAWQEINGERISVWASYVVETNGTISLALGAYDPAYPLVLDPTLTYSTYLGGSGFDQANGIAVDSNGEMLVAGITLSSNFPTMDPIQTVIGGSYDAFVARFNASGSALVYSTYLGGSDHDEAGGIAVDGSGYAYVSGHTSSANFPVANALQPGLAGNSDAFIAKLTPAGDALVYSTYLGGSHTDRYVEIDVTAVGEATVAGTTWSTDFPTMNAYDPTLNGAPDAFISRLNAAGSALVFSTYFGGSSLEEAFGIALDVSGNVALTGKTWSLDLPVLNAAQPTCALPLPCYDAFVTTLSSSGGSLLFSTYLGGGAGDEGRGIASGADGSVYVTGRTWSTDFPTQNPVQAAFAGGDSDAFVVAYGATGTRGFGTYFGGSARDDGNAIAVDRARYVYFAGFTASTNFPTVSPVQATPGGDLDAFAARLSPNGAAIAYSTYLGGNLADQGLGIDLLGESEAYITGGTRSTNFPVVSPYQPGILGSSEVFISRITDPTPHEEARFITYTYDPLYRLAAADYDDGTYFHYTYDPVGNRLTETTLAGTTNYVYDNANRLASVGGVPYSWSDNGNLLSDGTYTYAYDHASRLTSATWGTLVYAFAYNGLGDRLRQTVAGTPTNYTLDASASLSAGLAGGLTQVLSDGTNAYLYGNARIGEEQPGGWQYHLGDELGSVRQLVDANVGVALGRAYEPFGDPLLTTGAGSSIFGFTGEQRDGTGLVYLRARYYAPTQGRFLTRDVWEGDPNQPMSYNAWLYVYANPLNATDPSGMCPDEDLDGRCDPWWLRCEMIENPVARQNCLDCYEPHLAPGIPGLPDFDPFEGPTNLPIAGWGDRDRVDRAELVLRWLASYWGSDAWWRTSSASFDASRIKAWILFYEGGELEYAERTNPDSPDPLWLMARMINRDVGQVVRYDRVTATNLAEYTAFFNPRVDSIFDQRDWDFLTTEPDADYVQYIDAVGEASEDDIIRHWWSQNEIRAHQNQSEWWFVHRYALPTRGGESFFFGTPEQFRFHGIGT